MSKKIIYLSIFILSAFIISCNKEFKDPASNLENPSLSRTAASLATAATNLNFSGYPTLNSSYDWIRQDGFRGMYTYNDEKNNLSLMQTFKNKSINNVVINLQFGGNAPTDAQFADDCDKWVSIKNSTGLKIFWSIPFGSDEKYGNTQYGEFVGEDGSTINAPCPISPTYWNKVYGDRAKVAAQKGFTGCIVDMEMYGATQTRYPSLCYCNQYNWYPFCSKVIGTQYQSTPVTDRKALLLSLGQVQAYQDFQKNKVISITNGIRSSVQTTYPGFILGYLLYYEELEGITLGLGTTTKPALCLDEYTYDGTDNRTYNLLASIVNYENKEGLLISGYSPGFLSPNGITTAVGNINTIQHESGISNAGFFIWSSLAYKPNAPQGYGGLPGYTYTQYRNALSTIPY